MKVAFCLSGQMRTWKKCHYSWPLLFERFKEKVCLQSLDKFVFSEFYNESFEVDYFIHTWDFNTKPHVEWDIDWNPPNAELLESYYEVYDNIDNSEIDLMIDTINPKGYLIENWEKSKSRKSTMDEISTLNSFNKIPIQSHLSWSASQLYSIMMCAHMKQKYEIENKFKYDMCIRSRFDLEFDENSRMLFTRDFQSIKERTLYSVHNYRVNKYPFDAIGDIFYYGNSETFDLMSSIYELLPYIDKGIFCESIKIEEFMAFFVRMFMLDNEPLEGGPTIIRK